MALRYVILHFAVILFAINGINSITVDTPVGQIVGTQGTINVKGTTKTVGTYYGIPYAEPPVGDLRFAKPVPKRNFTTPFSAVGNVVPACVQIGKASGETSEDCLLLNIIAPDIAPSQTVPVMIWIHGGGFEQGSVNNYSAEYLSAAGNVIVVLVNYRLSELGFLSYGDNAAPGNYGLWDQQLAIKWVHNNIKAFGGDTSRVTIFGESAGATSVVYQTIYPGNQGLFQRAIAASGSITSAWALHPNDTSMQLSSNFASILGCSNKVNSEVIKCMRTKTTAEIITAINALGPAQSRAPVLDNDFILDVPAKILDGSTKATSTIAMFDSVDLVIGINSYDGTIALPGWMAQLNKTGTDPYSFRVSTSEYEDILIPAFLQGIFKTQIPDIVLDVTKLEYTDWSDSNDDAKRLAMLAKFSTDLAFAIPLTETAMKHVQSPSKSTYVYRFAARPVPRHVLAVPTLMDGPMVANHIDEVQFLFRMGDPVDIQQTASQMQVTTEELQTMFNVSSKMISMWTNFAKTGNPNQPVTVQSGNTINWPQYGGPGLTKITYKLRQP